MFWATSRLPVAYGSKSQSALCWSLFAFTTSNLTMIRLISLSHQFGWTRGARNWAAYHGLQYVGLCAVTSAARWNQLAERAPPHQCTAGGLPFQRVRSQVSLRELVRSRQSLSAEDTYLGSEDQPVTCSRLRRYRAASKWAMRGCDANRADLPKMQWGCHELAIRYPRQTATH